MSPKWKTGYWINRKAPAYYWHMTDNGVKQDNITMLEHQDLSISQNKSVELGQFGPAIKEVADASGRKEYNIKIGNTNGVLSKDGSKIYYWGEDHKVTTQEWVSDDQLRSIMDQRDHIDNPRYLQVFAYLIQVK